MKRTRGNVNRFARIPPRRAALCLAAAVALLPAAQAMEAVPPAAADLEPSLKDLPVQVVVEQ